MTAKKKAAPMGPESAPAAPAPVDHSPLDGWFELAPRTVKRYVQAIVGAASTDDGRPILTGVYVDANSDRLIMVATDSYRLYRITYPWTGVTLKACRGIVPAEWLSRVVRQQWGGGKIPPLRFTFDNRRVEAAYVADDDRAETMSTELIDGAGKIGFPNFEPVFDTLTAKSVGYPAALNPDYLGGVLRAAKLFRGTGSHWPVRVHGFDALKACVFQVVDDDTKAVFDMLLMPVRVP